MESRFLGTPISATTAASYKGIRAPLTVDESDFECSVKSRRNSTTGSSYYSGSELEKDEEILEEIKKFTFSDKNPDKEFGQESGNAVLRPSVRIPYERMYKAGSNFDDSDDSGSFLSDSGDDVAKDESFVVQKLHIPIAQVSFDSDEDSQGSVISNEEGFSGIVRIPSIEILRRINSAPKVRVLENEGDDDVAQIEFDDDLVSSRVVLGPSDVENSVQCDVLAEGPDADKEAMTNSLVVNEEVDSTLESGQNGDIVFLDEEIQEIGVISEFIELVGNEGIDSGWNGGAMHLDEVIQEIDVIDDLKKSVELVDHREHIDFSEDVMFLEDVSDCCNRSERVKSESEHEIGFFRQCVDIKEVFSEGPEFPELPNSVPEDARSIVVIDADQSVLEGSGLDQETRTKDENSDRFPGEVEESIFRSETKKEVIETDRVTDSTSVSNGDILLDQIITYFHEEVDADGGKDNYTPITEARNSGNFAPLLPNGELEKALSERDKDKIAKIQQIRVEYLRLLEKFGRSPEDSLASKVLQQLTLAEKSSSSQSLLLDFDSTVGNSVFSLSILVIGKTGVGKSATINSIFGEKKAETDAFGPSTTHVREIIGIIDGIELKVFDTPGLRSSFTGQSINWKILSSIKKLIQKFPPDIILYVDRLDAQTGLNDLTLLKLLTSYLGSSIWRKSIVAFTHGNSGPPDGPDGYPLSYEVFISQQSQLIKQLIGQLGPPVCVVENHPFAEKNVNGERWRSHLLLLCYSKKILSGLRSTVTIQCGENVVSDVELLCYSSDFDRETASFDGENPCFRYRFLEPFSGLLTRPVFDSPWDHDNVNETSVGLSITIVGENAVKGLKVRDRLAVGKRLILGGIAAFVQFSVGRNSKSNVTASNPSGTQLQIAAVAFVPIAVAVLKKVFGQSTED